nr:MAG TPA: hypothetical protein [Myoviridae sp. ctNPX13]
MNTTKRIHPYSFVPIRYNIVGNKRILESVLIFSFRRNTTWLSILL